jgi:hypothetical protein
LMVSKLFQQLRHHFLLHGKAMQSNQANPAAVVSTTMMTSILFPLVQYAHTNCNRFPQPSLPMVS